MVAQHGGAVGVAVSETSKVVVGSRAEAKAVRKAAQQAAKARGKSVAYDGKPAAFTPRAAIAPKAAAGAGAAATGAASVTIAAAGSAKGAAVPGGRTVVPKPAVAVPPFVPGVVAWNVTDMVMVLAMLLATVVAKDAVLGLHAVGLMPAAARTVVRASVLGVYYSLQLAVFAWLATRHHETLSRAFGLSGAGANDSKKNEDAPSVIGSAGLVLLLFAGAETFAIAYGLAMQSVGLSQPLRLSSDLAEVFGNGGVGLILSIVLVALVAPLAEELAFRGIVLPVLGARYGMWPAIAASAAVYAVYHFSAWLFAPTFVLGLALGWLAWSRRSLKAAIWLHVLYNAAAVAAGFLVVR